MSLGQPALVVPRAVNGQADPRALAEFCKNVDLRLKAIEAALQLSPNQTLQSLLQNLTVQPDGLVAKAAGVLVTRSLDAGAGVTITNPDAAAGNPSISSP